MKHLSRMKLATRSIRALFSPYKPNVTFLNHKDEYYKDYYFPKTLCDGIEMIAAVELCSKKAAAEMLMRAGLSSYMGGKLSQFIHDEKIAREHNQKLKMTRFVMMLKRYAKNRGMDISKLI